MPQRPSPLPLASLPVSIALLASVALLALGALPACGHPPDAGEASAKTEAPPPTLSFTQRHVVDDADHWWALTHGDLDGDGLADLVYIDANQDASGHLGYRRATLADTLWPRVVIAEGPPSGGGFAAGDLETGDIDADGDTDVLAVRHPGEWTDAAAAAQVFYYENDGTGAAWTPHAIGDVRGAVKDMSLGDFDGDGDLDLAVMTFAEHEVRVFRNDGPAAAAWTTVAEFTEEGIHEGMDVGDLDGDGDVDLAANGYTFTNPGGDLTGAWTVASIDDRWHDQTVHRDTWSLNATKTFVTDLDGDGTGEVFVSHSENAGFPINYYTRRPDGSWAPTRVLDSLPAAHTLMVYDMDLDGDRDVVTGVNGGRAVNLERGLTSFPVLVLLNDGSDRRFEPLELRGDGIYNGRVVDYDGDGDLDLFRYPDHESEDLYVLVNETLP